MTLLAVLLLGWVLVLDRASVRAAETEVKGTLTSQPEGSISLETGPTSYVLVGGLDFRPYIGKTVKLAGSVDDGTLYVGALTLGTIHLEDQGGIVRLITAGTVEQKADAYQVTVEGIAFQLTGSQELDQVVGKLANIEGMLAGTVVALTSLRTADGKEINIQAPEVPDLPSPTPDIGWGDQK
jgi:hypothetical protein